MMDVPVNCFGIFAMVNTFRILLIVWMQMVGGVGGVFATAILFQCVGTFVEHFLW